MEKAKKYLWKKIIEDLKNSNDEKLKNTIKAFDSEEDLKKFIQFYCSKSFDDMKRISSLCYFIRKEKYHYRNGRLLGNQTKAMPDEVYFKLLDYVKNKWGEKIKLALEFEGIEGPRGEDVVRIKLEDIDFVKHKVTIYNRKVGRVYDIPLNPNLEKELKQFISQNRQEIEEHKGFIFFSRNPYQKRDFISQKWLRNVVRKALDALGLNKIYSKDYKGRNLHLYSLHSLRGHAATRIYNKTHDLKKVQELLDHSPKSTDTTMLYIEKKDDDLKDVI